MTSRFLFGLAFLLAASSARAVEVAAAPPTRLVNVAANLEVTVVNGSTTVFKGYTDDHGRFETAPLEPGTYIFQLRIPKTIITPARYTLALSGARPLGDALVGPGVALGMNAQVRRPGPVIGQVSARRVIVIPAATSATAGAANPPTVNGHAATRAITSPPRSGTTSATTATSTQSPPPRTTIAASPPLTRPGVATPASPLNSSAATRSIAASPQSRITSTITPTSTQSRPARAAVTSAPATTAGAATLTPSPPLRATPASTTTSTTTTAAASPHLEPRPASYQPRIVNGRRYVWVQMAGANLGHWVPDNTGAQPSNPTRNSAPTAPPARRPNPRPTPRR